jgi:hypothetical protein
MRRETVRGGPRRAAQKSSEVSEEYAAIELVAKSLTCVMNERVVFSEDSSKIAAWCPLWQH